MPWVDTGDFDFVMWPDEHMRTCMVDVNGNCLIRRKYKWVLEEPKEEK